MYDLQCPECRSDKVKARYPELICLTCGFSEVLVDYPISHEHHRALCLDYGRPIPPPCLPIAQQDEPSLEPPDSQKAGLEHISSILKSDEFAQLQGRVNWLQGKLEEHLTRST